MRSFVFLLVLAWSFPAFAQAKLGSEAAPKANAKKSKSAKAKKPETQGKMAAKPKSGSEPKLGSQGWDRYTSTGDKSVAEQQQNKQAAKSAAAKK